MPSSAARASSLSAFLNVGEPGIAMPARSPFTSATNTGTPGGREAPRRGPAASPSCRCRSRRRSARGGWRATARAPAARRSRRARGRCAAMLCSFARTGSGARGQAIDKGTIWQARAARWPSPSPSSCSTTRARRAPATRSCSRTRASCSSRGGRRKCCRRSKRPTRRGGERGGTLAGLSRLRGRAGARAQAGAARRRRGPGPAGRWCGSGCSTRRRSIPAADVPQWLAERAGQRTAPRSARSSRSSRPAAISRPSPRCKEAIRAGDIYQANLTMPLAGACARRSAGALRRDPPGGRRPAMAG